MTLRRDRRDLVAERGVSGRRAGSALTLERELVLFLT